MLTMFMPLFIGITGLCIYNMSMFFVIVQFMIYSQDQSRDTPRDFFVYHI